MVGCLPPSQKIEIPYVNAPKFLQPPTHTHLRFPASTQEDIGCIQVQKSRDTYLVNMSSTASIRLFPPKSLPP